MLGIFAFRPTNYTFFVLFFMLLSCWRVSIFLLKNFFLIYHLRSNISMSICFTCPRTSSCTRTSLNTSLAYFYTTRGNALAIILKWCGLHNDSYTKHSLLICSLYEPLFGCPLSDQYASACLRRIGSLLRRTLGNVLPLL